MQSAPAKNRRTGSKGFLPGQSGNPAGRPRGVKSWDSRIRDQMREDLPALLEKLREKALGGDRRSLQFLVNCVLPVLRATSSHIELPALAEASTLTDKANAVLAGVAGGEIAPDVGAALIDAIGKVVAVTEIDEVQRRLKALEDRTVREADE